MKTKLDTSVIIVKAFCYVLIGGLTPLGASLAQWANSGESPGRIVWITIIAGCIVGGATQLLSFLSGSYSDYVSKGANGTNGTTQTQVSLPKLGGG